VCQLDITILERLDYLGISVRVILDKPFPEHLLQFEIFLIQLILTRQLILNRRQMP
jgi:hypothetical protein